MRALFAITGTTSKYLSTNPPSVEIQSTRYVLFFAMASTLATRSPGRPLRPRNPKSQSLCGACVTGSSLLFVYGIREMTMAEATTPRLLSPLPITALSVPLLDEIIGVRRLAAVQVGMAGMLILVRPGPSGYQPAAPFGVATSGWALALIITRGIALVGAPRRSIRTMRDHGQPSQETD